MRMKSVLLTVRSVTYAQQMKNLIEKNGIAANIVRPDIRITKGNCAYAVNVSQVFLAEVIEILKRYRLLPVRVVLTDGIKHREIAI